MKIFKRTITQVILCIICFIPLYLSAGTITYGVENSKQKVSLEQKESFTSLADSNLQEPKSEDIKSIEHEELAPSVTNLEQESPITKVNQQERQATSPNTIVTNNDLGNEQWFIQEVERQTGKKVAKALTFENLNQISSITIKDENLSGKIPPEISRLTNLKRLQLINSKISGKIPKEIGNLSQLETLLLWRNQLEGEIPPELGRLTNLKKLHLNSNKLIGQIPNILFNLQKNTGFVVLDVSRNQVTVNRANLDYLNGKTIKFTQTFLSNSRMSSKDQLEIPEEEAELHPFDRSKQSFFGLAIEPKQDFFPHHIFTIIDTKTNKTVYEGPWDSAITLPITTSTTYRIILDKADQNPNNVTEVQVKVIPGTLNISIPKKIELITMIINSELQEARRKDKNWGIQVTNTRRQKGP
ncbi:leucine-rich repeat domain-containing protein [Bacillus sp. AR18-7]|uniref:leucine-rich repeat domain-containing protein n=1 Tax=Bacillus sp. AR18-7 TaxID=2217821 RepID=UPI0011C7514F|nr:leucine-rich repeat domain-containing protein [Bacillus sp. AR18-7]TXR68234.1 hypothetical protein DN395_00680 [Bacillus sp. AR18-7]